MPVRKIPKNYIHVTGGFASRKNGRMTGFESLLEKDLMILLEFDDSVERFEEQPVKIPVPSGRGRASYYVSDILVHYRQQGRQGKPRKPVLFEVKHVKDLEKNKTKYQPKFEAARKLAMECGWGFRIATEKDIRSPYLSNLKFLREYHQIQPAPALIDQVLQALGDIGGVAGFDTLLDHASPTDVERLHAIPVVWHLVATRRITADLKVPLSDSSRLSLPKRPFR